MKYILIVLLSQLIFANSCNNQNTDFDNTFNKTEIVTINEIVAQFDEVMKYKTGQKITSKAYFEFSDYVKHFESIEDFHDRIFSIKPEIDSIIRKYKNTVFFKNTWTYNCGFKHPNSNETVNTFLDIQPKAKYIDFLKLKSKKNKVIEYYLERYESCYCIPPILFAQSPYLIENLDLNNETDRFILAVHFITIISETNKNQQLTTNIVHALVSFSQKKN